MKLQCYVSLRSLLAITYYCLSIANAHAHLRSTRLIKPEEQLVSTASQDEPHQGRVLLYWAAKYSPQIVALVKDNVNHLRGAGLDCDVLLLHYDEQKDLWLQQDRPWYESNVRWGMNKPGWKLHLLKRFMAWYAEEVEGYEWVWMIDEDMDMTRTEPSQLLRDLAATGSMIVGPSFLQMVSHSPDAQVDETLVQQFTTPRLQMNTPHNETCRFRYVPMVEMISPIVKLKALNVLFDCATCMGNTTDWGIDHIWCDVVAKRLKRDRHTACAILDHTGPVVHRNWQTSVGNLASLTQIKKSSENSRSDSTSNTSVETETAGLANIRYVRAHHLKSYVRSVVGKKEEWPDFKCVPN